MRSARLLICVPLTLILLLSPLCHLHADPSAETAPSFAVGRATQSIEGFQLRRVVIDPGHGGIDPGNVSLEGVEEKQVNLSVAAFLADQLKKQGLQTVLLRKSDKKLSLEQRAELANVYPAHETLFISLHCNSWHGRSAFGCETYVFDFAPSDEHSAYVARRENLQRELTPIDFILSDLNHRGSERYNLEIAQLVQEQLVSHLGTRDRHVRQAPLRVLAYVHMPAILVEMGFLSHPEEGQKLCTSEYQKQVATALTEAILRFQKTMAHWHHEEQDGGQG